MDKIIKIGMADLQAAKYPGTITTLGLGSCLGIALYDTAKKIIGLAHIMLPSSFQAKSGQNLAKFADTAIVKLVEEMTALGACKENITAKLAGGAQMFTFSASSDMIKIGLKNVAAAKEKLKELCIPLISEDTGGSYGRTIELYSDDGRLVIKTIGHGIKQI